MGILHEDVVVISQAEKPDDPTVITVNCPDKTGLGCDLCRIILLFGLSISRGGKASSFGSFFFSEFFSEFRRHVFSLCVVCFCFCFLMFVYSLKLSTRVISRFLIEEVIVLSDLVIVRSQVIDKQLMSRCFFRFLVFISLIWKFIVYSFSIQLFLSIIGEHWSISYLFLKIYWWLSFLLIFGVADVSTDGKWCYVVFWVAGKSNTRWDLLKNRLVEVCPSHFSTSRIYSYRLENQEQPRPPDVFLLKFWCSQDRKGLLHGTLFFWFEI